MLVFIDESGDPGFKLGKGSSQIFVLAMVAFETADAATLAEQAVRKALSEHRVKPEWKFNKTSSVKRDAFFDVVSGCDFLCRAVVVQKELIRSHNLQTSPQRFYRFFTRMMCQHDGGILQDAKIVIDGSGDRAFKQELQSYLRRELPPGTIKKMAFKDSQKDCLVQLADMCAGAIARSYSDKKDACKWRAKLAKADKLDDVWEFR